LNFKVNFREFLSAFVGTLGITDTKQQPQQN